MTDVYLFIPALRNLYHALSCGGQMKSTLSRRYRSSDRNEHMVAHVRLAFPLSTAVTIDAYQRAAVNRKLSLTARH